MTAGTETPRAGFLDRIARVVLPSPSELGRPGTIVAPLTIVLLVAVATAAATQFFGTELVAGRGALEPRVMARIVWVLAALSPLLALLKGTVLAVAAWAFLTFLGGTAAFRPVLSALLYGEAILSFQVPAVILTLLLQGGPHEGPVPVATGLDAFVGGAHPVLLAFARGITPFHILWVVFLGFALASCARAPRTHGFATAMVLWSLMIGLGVLRAVVTLGAS